MMAYYEWFEQHAQHIAAIGGAATEVAAPPSSGSSLATSEDRLADDQAKEAAAGATYALAALRSSGLLPGLLQPNSSEAMTALHLAQRGGSLDATLALADRFLMVSLQARRRCGQAAIAASSRPSAPAGPALLSTGPASAPPPPPSLFQGRGVLQSCPMGLHYVKAGAQRIIQIIDSTADFTAPVAPTDLRERFIDMSYFPPDREHAEDVVAMEEDMALRGNRDAQRRWAGACRGRGETWDGRVGARLHARLGVVVAAARAAHSRPGSRGAPGGADAPRPCASQAGLAAAGGARHRGGPGGRLPRLSGGRAARRPLCVLQPGWAPGRRSLRALLAGCTLGPLGAIRARSV
jgi:hypothetical protein